MIIRLVYRISILALMTAALVTAQETRKTIVNRSPNPADDTKENSAAVPDVFAITGHFDRIGVGSVRGYQIHQVVNRTMPSHDTFEKNPTQPADLVSMNGYVINGRIHAHVTLGTPEKAIAGHLDPGTTVFTFAVITIGVMNDADLSRVDDKTYR